MKKDRSRRQFLRTAPLAATSLMMMPELLARHTTSITDFTRSNSDIQTPAWVKNAIFYQIFPDRFARSKRIKHSRGISFAPWESPGTDRGFLGGDLLGIVDHLDYLKDLGISALYLNPVFAAATNHRYNAYDYFKVDPLLGGNAALRELIDKAHSKDVRVVLDGVFNHCGRGFWAFHHILECQQKSPYVDWFHIEDWPLKPYSYIEHTEAGYAHWSRFPTLPKFNIENPGVRDYLLSVARHWMDFGADGWRLDVAGDIEDDTFWQEFRSVVKGANPDAYIVGEHWQESQKWLKGDMFDAVMNYIFASATMGFFGAETLSDYNPRHWPFQKFDAEGFRDRLAYNLDLYDPEINMAMLNLIGSHDTPRAIEILGYDWSALKLSVLFQMTMPGAPCVYYGDEIGMKGHARDAFPYQDPSGWNREILDHYKSALRLRNEHPVFRTGTYKVLLAREKVFVFERRLGDKTAVVAFNASEKSEGVNIPAKLTAPKQVWPLVSSGSVRSSGKGMKFEIAARDATVFIS